MEQPTFPQQDAALTLAGPVGALQVEVEFPEADVAAQPVVAIVCHPLPTEGGTMNNKVVTMAASAQPKTNTVVLIVTIVRLQGRGWPRFPGTNREDHSLLSSFFEGLSRAQLRYSSCMIPLYTERCLNLEPD